jgi:type I restriction enzyme S subunit
MRVDQWHPEPLGALTENLDGRRIPVKEGNRKKGIYPYYGASGIVDWIDRYIFDGEHLLIAEDGENLRTRNTPIAFLASGKFWVNNHAHVVRGNLKADTRFLMYALNNTDISGYLSGSTMPKLTQGNMKRIPVLTPPLQEQRAIASVLGSLDNKIALNRRMSETVEAIAHAIFKEHFANKTRDGLPEGWRLITLNEATSLIIDHRGKTPKKLGSEWSEFGTPAISAKNIKAGRLVEKQAMKFVSRELYLRWMRDELAIGDVLITSEAPLGEALYVLTDGAFCLSQRVFALRANPEVCLPTYLYLWLRSAFAQKQLAARSTGTTVTGIRQSELRRVTLPVPPIYAQLRSHTILDSLLRRIAANEAETENLEALRDTLLPKLLSGELRVQGQI